MLPSGAFLTATSVSPAGYAFLDKMNPAYSGPAIRVRRASDSAEQDIGFSGTSFDIASAQAFQGASYLIVLKAYNQDGSGNDFLTSGQPRLWLGEGGPTIESYASAQPFQIPAALVLQRNACSVFMIGRTPGLGATNGYFMFGDSTIPNNDFGMTTARTSGQVGMQPMVGGSTIAPTTANKATQPIANLGIEALVSGTDKITIHRDEQTGIFPAAASLLMNAGGQIGGGNTYVGRHSLKGFAFYPAALSDADATTLKGVLKSTFGTASAPTRAMHAQGDSIIFGTGGVNNFTITAAMAVRLGPTVLLRNNGIAGHQLSQHYQDYNNASTRSRFIVDGVENTYFSDYGHNDIKALVTDSATASSVVATMQTQIKAMCADLRAAGYAKIIWQETFPDVATTWTSDMESARNAWNAFLRSNPADANGAPCFDAIDKVASDSAFIFGDAETAAGRGMRLTSISSDGVHPNESVAGARADHLIATHNAIGTAQPAPSWSVAPSISPSSGTIGQVFTVSDGTVQNGSVTVRQWKLNGSPINGANASTYTSAAAGTLTCTLTATGSNGQTAQITATGVTVQEATAPVTPTVTLSGAQSKSEGNSGATLFTYTVTRSASSGAVTVPWSFSAGTTNASDFTGGTLPTGGNVTMADGASTGTFTVSVNGDTTVEPDETFSVSIAAPSGYAAGATMSANGTILNDDVAAGYMLDNVSATPAAVFSVRRVRTGYSGPGLKVRRSTPDTTTLDIGFLSNGDLDTTTMANFVGSGDGFIDTWYDQSPAAVHATQATLASQPKIVANGVLGTRNGKPIIAFANATSLVSNLSASSTTRSLRMVGDHRTNANSDILRSSASGGWNLRTSAAHALQLLKQAGAVLFASTALETLNVSSIFGVDYDSTNYKVDVDGNANSGTTAAAAFTAGLTTILGGASSMNTGISTLMAFDGATLSTQDDTTIRTSLKTYYGTP